MTQRPGQLFRGLLGFLLMVGLGAVLLPATAGAVRLPDLPMVEIVGPEEVLAYHSDRGPDGRLHFRTPGGSAVPFVTSIDDPEILHRGDGAFFPAEVVEIEEALQALPTELIGNLDLRIYVLPYPRSGMLSSSADSRAIYLSPGVRPYEPVHVHYLVAHEVGHLFHRRYLPYDDAAGWEEYRSLRGIEDTARFRFDGPHADRPQEILAEDFRVLFGSDLARGDGSVENREIERPENVSGLEAYLVRLALGFQEPDLADRSGWRLAPNPVLVGERLQFRGPEASAGVLAEIFDIAGRRVAAMDLRSGRNGSWESPVPSDLATGAYWVRLRRDGADAVTLPLRVVRR